MQMAKKSGQFENSAFVIMGKWGIYMSYRYILFTIQLIIKAEQVQNNSVMNISLITFCHNSNNGCDDCSSLGDMKAVHELI